MIFLYCLKNSFMNAWKFDWIWISDLNENECLSTWNLIFFILLEECIYECVKFLWILWTKMHEFFLPFWYCSFFLRIHSWMHETLWILWMKMHAWMHEFFLSFWYFFFKNAFMNAWNFVNFLNKSACLNTLILFVFLILFFFKKKRMHLWMHKTWFFLFYYFWRMHIWMHEIWFSFVLLFFKNAYMNAWNFTSFFLFYYFLFWMKMHEILFSWIIIFDANVCTKFS